MVYLATFVFSLIFLQFLVALSNVLFAEKMKNAIGETTELVSVLIPARNEEKNIQTILHDMLNQSYQHFELIVYDDESTDKTREIVRDYEKKDPRIQLLKGRQLPADWLGKNHACYKLAKHAKGAYFLFLDADVRISGDIIEQAIAYTKKYHLSLISIFPKQIMKSFGEKITVPVMNYILLTLLPLMLVRISKRSSLSAANGQFMFFSAKEYLHIQPHRLFKSNKVEDIAISRFYKNSKLKMSCQVGDERISCRMYENYHEAVVGFSKNVVAFFGHSNFAAVLFWLITTFGIIAVAAYKVWWLVPFISIYLLTRVFVSIASHQHIVSNLLLLVHQQFALAVFIAKSIQKSAKNQHQWKGRNI
jgi:glycosyltransferase involved in cell wall biosynthesis